MMVCEDILTELMADAITKIIGEPGQGDINTIESKLAAKAANIKIKGDIFEKGQKYGFFVMVLRRAKCGTVIGNLMVQSTSLENTGGYDETIQSKDSSFNGSEGKKEHAKRVIEYKTFLRVKERIQTLIQQAVEKP